MRNNPKFGHNKDFEGLFGKFAKIEKMRRFWKTQKPWFSKLFFSLPYQANFCHRHIDEFTAEIDKWAEAGGHFT